MRLTVAAARMVLGLGLGCLSLEDYLASCELPSKLICARMEPKSIEFHYLKSPDFKTVHADGAFGGPTPQGGIFVSFYLERPVIPQRIKFSIENDGRLQTEMHREGKAGMVREVDCGITMSLSTAKSLREWLSGQIDLIEKAQTVADPKQEKT